MRRKSGLAVATLWPRLWCEETHSMRRVQLSIRGSAIVNRPCWSQNGHSFEVGGPTSLKWVKLCLNHSRWSLKARSHCKKLNGHSKIGSSTGGGNTRGPPGTCCDRIREHLESSYAPKDELIDSGGVKLPPDERPGRSPVELSRPLNETSKEVPALRGTTGAVQWGRLELVAINRWILESSSSPRKEFIAWGRFTRKISLKPELRRPLILLLTVSCSENWKDGRIFLGYGECLTLDGRFVVMEKGTDVA